MTYDWSSLPRPWFGRRVRGNFRGFTERILHVVGYHLVLRRPGTRVARVAGFRLTIRPTVYDPRYGVAPPYFVKYIDGLDFKGKVVADLGTGSGILALAAARAGATSIVAVDVNPAAAATAAENARAINSSEHRFATCIAHFTPQSSQKISPPCIIRAYYAHVGAGCFLCVDDQSIVESSDEHKQERFT